LETHSHTKNHQIAVKSTFWWFSFFFETRSNAKSSSQILRKYAFTFLNAKNCEEYYSHTILA
ncbi:hypothetical protein, partial [Levilactobacillus brevis]|uniref:hypothetical protein n=1 Tax=Levilactobacillus brevis TaxID=1580 RepID=UPI001CDCAD33